MLYLLTPLIFKILITNIIYNLKLCLIKILDSGIQVN